MSSAAIDDSLTMHTMRAVHARCGGYLLDPHTAVGVAAAQQFVGGGGGGGGGGPVACMGCAHPMKFLQTVAATFGCSPEQAFVMASGAPGHRCVEAVGHIARRARDGYPTAGWVPPGCCAVLRKTANWEAEWTAAVRAKVEALSARAALRSQL